MTKKDYEAIAAILREEGPKVPGGLFPVIVRMARLFADDNPRFDADRFFAACTP